MANEMNDEPVKVVSYIAGGVRLHGRVSVRDEIDNRIHVELHSFDGEGIDYAEMRLTVGQAVDLIENLARATRQFCERRDIKDALLRTDPLTEV